MNGAFPPIRLCPAEVAGTIVAAGEQVKRVKVGDRVGLGWFSASCLHCPQCLAGDHNLCATAEQTMIGRFGGFADRVRCHWLWATPLPAAIDAVKAGPLFCGGITVFNPIVQCGVQPTQRVGVIGIGGLGHMALQFLNKWGCEVVAFTSSDAKRQDALNFGAHDTVSSRDAAQMQKLAGSLDFILVTANVTLDWNAILATLAPKGRLHVVGAVPEPIPVPAFTLLSGQKAVSGSPLGVRPRRRRCSRFARGTTLRRPSKNSRCRGSTRRWNICARARPATASCWKTTLIERVRMVRQGALRHKLREVEKKEKTCKLFPIRLTDFEALCDWTCFDAEWIWPWKCASISSPTFPTGSLCRRPPAGRMKHEC